MLLLRYTKTLVITNKFYSRSGMPAHYSLRVERTNVAASRKSGTYETFPHWSDTNGRVPYYSFMTKWAVEVTLWFKLNQGVRSVQSIEKIVAIFDIIQDDAANNCIQSPVVLMPYANTLSIQHRLAVVCPSHPTVMTLLIRLCCVPDDNSISTKPKFSLPFNMRCTPARSKRDRPNTSPSSYRLAQSHRSRAPKKMLCSEPLLQIAAWIWIWSRNHDCRGERKDHRDRCR